MTPVSPTGTVATSKFPQGNDIGFLADDVVEHMPNGVAYCRMVYQDGRAIDFVYLYTNPAFHKQTGLGDVRGKPATDVLPGIRESNPQLLELYGRVAAGGKAEQFETFIDALQQWFSVQVFCPRPGHFVAIFDVVTDRKRTEQTLRDGQRQLTAILNATTESVFHVDREGVILAINETAARRLRNDSRTLIGRCVFDFFPPQVAAVRRAVLADVFASGRERHTEDTRHDRYYSLEYYPIVDSQGTVASVVVYAADVTERRLYQLRLERSLAEQKALLDNDLIGIVTVRNRIIVWANSAYEKMLGYESGELVGMATRRTYPSEDAYAAFGDAAYPILGSGGVFRLEIEQVRKDGARIWVDVSGEMLDEEDKESLWGFVEITERRRLESKLSESMQRMELALSGADLGMWDLDLPSGNFTHNARLVTMLGYGPGAIEANLRAFVGLLHPADRDRLSASWIAHLKGSTSSFAAEYRVRHTSDEWIWMLSRGKVVERDTDGQAVRLTGTTLDVTERKRAETELEERKNRLATLIASMQDFVFVVDTGCTIVEYFQPPQAKTPPFAVSGSVLGKTYSDVMSADAAQELTEAIGGIITDGRPRTFEYVVARNDGECSYQATTSALSGPSVYPTGFLTVVRDITTERKAQKEMEHLARTNTLLLDSVGEGVFGVDLLHGITFVNAAALSALGFKETDLLGRQQHVVFHHHRQDGTDYPADQCPITATLVDGQVRRVHDEWFWRKDGSGFPVALTVAPLVENSSLVGAVVVFQDISARKASEAKIRELAFYDSLTMLPNRRLLLDRLEMALPASGRRNAYGALLFLDLDNLKQLNDTHGHEFGDLLLVEVAKRLLSSVRSEDTVARLGGDEFVVMLEDLSSERLEAEAQAVMVGEKVRNALSLSHSIQGQVLNCTSSIGIYVFKGLAEPASEVLKRADTAMYEAKSGGRNMTRLFRVG